MSNDKSEFESKGSSLSLNNLITEDDSENNAITLTSTSSTSTNSNHKNRIPEKETISDKTISPDKEEEIDDLLVKNSSRSKLTSSDIRLILYLIITIKPFKYIGDRSLSQTKKWEIIQQKFSEIKQKSLQSQSQQRQQPSQQQQSSNLPGSNVNNLHLNNNNINNNNNNHIIIPTVRTLQRQLSSAIKKSKFRQKNNNVTINNLDKQPIFKNINENSSLVDLEMAVLELFELSETLKNGKIANSSLLEYSLEVNNTELTTNRTNITPSTNLPPILPESNPSQYSSPIPPINQLSQLVAPSGQSGQLGQLNQLGQVGTTNQFTQISPILSTPNLNFTKRHSTVSTDSGEQIRSGKLSMSTQEIDLMSPIDKRDSVTSHFENFTTIPDGELLDSNNILNMTDLNNLREFIKSLVNSGTSIDHKDSIGSKSGSHHENMLELVKNLNNKYEALRAKELSKLSSYQKNFERFNHQQLLINKSLIEQVINYLKLNGDEKNIKLIENYLPKI